MRKLLLICLILSTGMPATLAQVDRGAETIAANASQRNFSNLAAAKALAAGPTINLRDGEVFHIQGFGTYYYSLISAAVPDDAQVIQLAQWPGRLLRIASDSAVGAAFKATVNPSAGATTPLAIATTTEPTLGRLDGDILVDRYDDKGWVEFELTASAWVQQYTQPKPSEPDGKLLTGQFDAGAGSFPAANAGDWFRVSTGGTIGTATLIADEWWQALNDTASGNSAAVVASWTLRKPPVSAGVVDVVRFDTVADMVASTIGTDVKDGDIVITKGYAAEGDLGANTYRYRIPTGSPGTEDGGFIIDHGVNGQFIATDQSIVNVDKFGALGNNTDDQPVIQAALAVAKASGVNVRLGPKTYRLNSSLTIPEDISIFGMGASQDSTKAVTRLNFTPTVASSCLVFPDTASYRRNRELRDFSILAGNTLCQSGIVLNRPRDMDVRNVDILGTTINKWTNAALQMQGTLACTFESMTITHSNLAAIQINGNSNTTTNFKRVYGTLCDHYAVVQNCFMVTFQECIADSLTTAGIDIARGSRVNAINCHFENVPLSNAVAGHVFDVGTSAGTRTFATELKTILHVSGGLYEGTNVAGGGPNANTTFVQGLSSDEIVIEDVSVDNFGRLFGLSTVHTKSLVTRNVTTQKVKGTWPSTIAASNDLEINGFKSSGITSIRDRVDWVAGRSYQSGDIALLTPDWTASRVYAANEFVISPNDSTTIQRITAGTSAATFALDAANWRTMLTPNYFNAYEIQTNHTSDANFEVDFAAGRVSYLDKDVYYAQMATGGDGETHQSQFGFHRFNFISSAGGSRTNSTLVTSVSQPQTLLESSTNATAGDAETYQFDHQLPISGWVRFEIEQQPGNELPKFLIIDGGTSRELSFVINETTGAIGAITQTGGATFTTPPVSRIDGDRIIVTFSYDLTTQEPGIMQLLVTPDTTTAGGTVNWAIEVDGCLQESGPLVVLDTSVWNDFYISSTVGGEPTDISFANIQNGDSGVIEIEKGFLAAPTWTGFNFGAAGPPDVTTADSLEHFHLSYFVKRGIVNVTWIDSQ